MHGDPAVGPVEGVAGRVLPALGDAREQQPRGRGRVDLDAWRDAYACDTAHALSLAMASGALALAGPGGETVRHGRLKPGCRKACGFESRPGHCASSAGVAERDATSSAPLRRRGRGRSPATAALELERERRDGRLVALGLDARLGAAVGVARGGRPRPRRRARRGGTREPYGRCAASRRARADRVLSARAARNGSERSGSPSIALSTSSRRRRPSTAPSSDRLNVASSRPFWVRRRSRPPPSRSARSVGVEVAVDDRALLRSPHRRTGRSGRAARRRRARVHWRSISVAIRPPPASPRRGGCRAPRP